MALPQTLEPKEKGIALYDGKGNFLGFEDIVVLTDEQLTEEAEQKAMEKAKDIIDSISNLADAKVFLKKLCLRLFKNGALP